MRRPRYPQEEAKPERKPLDISEYVPKSMLHVPETPCPAPNSRSSTSTPIFPAATRYEKGVAISADREYPETPEELLQVMDQKKYSRHGEFNRRLR